VIKWLSEDEQQHLVNEMDNCVKAFYIVHVWNGRKRSMACKVLIIWVMMISREGYTLLRKTNFTRNVLTCMLHVTYTIPEEIVDYVEQHFQTTIEILEIHSEDDVDDEDDAHGMESEENVV
jgi:hypothetical protein